MPYIEKHPPGDFCWIDLGTTDIEAADNFYHSVFGWHIKNVPIDPENFISIYQLEDRAVAAAYPLRPEQRSKGMMPHWMVYVAVDNADEAANRVSHLGGKVIAPPFDMSDSGRMATFQDPLGGVFSVWQAKKNIGMEITGVDGTLCWAELSTPDPARASQFYSDLFGWKVVADERDPTRYLHIVNGESYIGGFPLSERRDRKVSPRWLIYFAVSDCDAVANRAEHRGAKIHLPPTTHEGVGRMAVIADPEGAVFALFQSARHG
jgi:predicted enzyme related to lactoylglutathione lyase